MHFVCWVIFIRAPDFLLNSQGLCEIYVPYTPRTQLDKLRKYTWVSNLFSYSVVFKFTVNLLSKKMFLYLMPCRWAKDITNIAISSVIYFNCATLRLFLFCVQCLNTLYKRKHRSDYLASWLHKNDRFQSIALETYFSCHVFIFLSQGANRVNNLNIHC